MAKPQKNKKEQNNQKPLKQYLKYSTMGFQMIGVVVLGVLLGNWLDNTYNPGGRTYTLILSLSSIALALYLALKDFLKPSK